MAEEKLDTNVPSEQNGTLEPTNGNEEPAQPSLTVQNKEDEEKDEEKDEKGDLKLYVTYYFTLLWPCS